MSIFLFEICGKALKFFVIVSHFFANNADFVCQKSLLSTAKVGYLDFYNSHIPNTTVQSKILENLVKKLLSSTESQKIVLKKRNEKVNGSLTYKFSCIKKWNAVI